MIKTATPKTTTAISIKKANMSKKVFSPGGQFVGASLSMSWQLAVVVLIPIIGGYEVDKHFNTSPGFTIFGFVLAMIGTTIVIKKTLNEFSLNPKNQDKK